MEEDENQGVRSTPPHLFLCINRWMDWIGWYVGCIPSLRQMTAYATPDSNEGRVKKDDVIHSRLLPTLRQTMPAATAAPAAVKIAAPPEARGCG